MHVRPTDLKYVPTVMSYLGGRARTWGPPVFFAVETLNTCNLRCVYCPQSKPDEHFANGRGRMSLEQFDVVLDRLVEAFHPRMLALHRDGEPLLNRTLEAYIEHATARGMQVSFSSNGTLLNRERAESLIRAGLRSVCTDFTADAAVYEALRVGAHWQQTHDGLLALLDVAESLNAPTHILVKDLAASGPESPATRASLEATRSLFRAHPKRVHVIPTQFHNALLHSIQDLSRPSRRAKPEYNLCHQPWVNMSIDWSGRVVGCCRDLRSEYVLGNILEQPAWEIWNGEPMQRLRRALTRRRPQDIAICKSCDLPWSGSYSGRTPVGRVANFMFSRTWKTT